LHELPELTLIAILCEIELLFAVDITIGNYFVSFQLILSSGQYISSLACASTKMPGRKYCSAVCGNNFIAHGGC
jgi:hypothetical protein